MAVIPAGTTMPTHHDGMFKHAFSDPQHAGPLLRALLDPAITAAIDWRTLQRAPDTFVDERQREQRTDILFTVRIRDRDGFLLVLPEHKSRPDRWLPLQGLSYIVGIWKQLHREQPDRQLPPILLVVVHCGARPWRATSDLRALIDLEHMPPAIVAAQPSFSCPPHDFANRTPAEVRAMALTLFGLATIAAMQFVAPVANEEEALIPRLAEWADVARRIVSDPHGHDAVEALSSYLLSLTRLPRSRLRVVVEREFGSRTMKKFVSTLEQLRREGMDIGKAAGLAAGKAAGLAAGKAAGLAAGRAAGLAAGKAAGLAAGRAEGRVDGRAEAKAETLLLQLEQRFGALPAATQKKVRGARIAELDRWLRRVLDATSLAAVFARSTRR